MLPLPLLLLLLLILASGMACHKSTPTTPSEKVANYNAALAEANLAIETGVQTLASTKVLTVPQAAPVIELTARIAVIHEQITNILSVGSALTSSNIVQIQALIAQIDSAAQTLIANGSLGIKNPQTQNTVSQDLTSIVSLANLILNLLPQLLANPAPSATPVAPAIKKSPSGAGASIGGASISISTLGGYSWA